MPASFLHGSEFIELYKGPTPIRIVKTAIIGLVGSAPKGPVNQLTLVNTDKDAAAFGLHSAGFTIPMALKPVFNHGGALVMVINVCDPTVHKTTITDEAVTLVYETGKTSKPNINTVTVKNSAATVTYALNTDYTFDADTGVIKRKVGGGIAANAALKVTYTYVDPTKVTNANIIGGTDAAEKRTGIKHLEDAFSLFGAKPKILLAPSFSTQTAIVTELSAMANKLRAMTYVDAPIGTTVQQAITGRGAAGTINFNTNNGRTRLCYPHYKVYNAGKDIEELQPSSMFWAAVRCKTDAEKGYWASSSNKEILGITGVERPMTASISDPQSNTMMLNEVGISTVFNSYGTGYRTWGNRLASYPVGQEPDTMECVKVVGDVLAESLEYFSMNVIDGVVNKQFLQNVIESMQGLLRKLKADGAILDGNAWIDPSDNPVSQLAAGQTVYCYDFMPPMANERMTFKAYMNKNYLADLVRL